MVNNISLSQTSETNKMIKTIWVMIVFTIYLGDPNRELVSLEKEFDNQIECEETLQEIIIFLQRSGFIGIGKCDKKLGPII